MDHIQNNNTVLKEKIALITGGTKGIGKAVADRLAQVGQKLLLQPGTIPAI